MYIKKRKKISAYAGKKKFVHSHSSEKMLVKINNNN